MAETHGHRLEVDARGVARITLDRPEVHNAFDAALIAGLTATLEGLAKNHTVRVVILAGAGPNFSAGADVNWMREQAGYDEARNLEDARKLAYLMRTLDRLPKPTIARVQGAALAGAIGLIACCDIAIAGANSSFGISEVKLGLIPATISPYVVAAVGARGARRLFLTAERFPANEARRLGLVHEVVAEDALDARIEEVVAQMLVNAPRAIAEAKELIALVVNRQVDDELAEETAKRIARRRASAEGKEGLSAFLAKRKPVWPVPGKN